MPNRERQESKMSASLLTLRMRIVQERTEHEGHADNSLKLHCSHTSTRNLKAVRHGLKTRAYEKADEWISRNRQGPRLWEDRS